MTDSYDDLVRFLNGLSDGDFNEQGCVATF
jgi:hypothetical protein